MRCVSTRFARAAIVLFFATAALRADGFFNQFWPEADAYIQFLENSRFFLSYQQTREDHDYNTNDELGAGIDFFFQPLIKARELRNPNIEKNRFITVRLGYLFDKTPPNVKNQYTAKTALIELTPRYFLPKGILMTDENRGDFRFQNGEFAPRYRNRLRAERTFDVLQTKSITPYIQAQAFWDSRYDVFYRLEYTAGDELQVTKNVVIETYFTRQQNSRPKFSSANAIGLTVQIYFQRERPQ